MNIHHRTNDHFIAVRAYQTKDLTSMISIWNEIVEEGNAFPQEECLDQDSGEKFFSDQSHCGVAVNRDDEPLGLYILHPNNVGRCGHLCNASYAVSSQNRGLHIGEKLVLDCMEKARDLGFRVLQFNAVVATNTRAIRLYERLGFHRLGTIPGGFRLKDGSFEDICPYFIQL